MANSMIEEFKRNLDTYTTGLVATLKEKSPLVARALNALKLQGSTRAQLKVEADAPIVAHEQDIRAHEVTPLQVGAYSKAGFEDLLGSRVRSGMMPISRFGSLSNTPPPVFGNFEGASTERSISQAHALVLEDDGTLRFLRNGTNGSKAGVYHGHIKNAMAPEGVGEVVRSPIPYRPSFFPQGTYARYITFGDQNVIAGRLANTSDDALGDYFIALTGQTLDETVHQGCRIAAANWPAMTGSVKHPEVVFGNGRVYFIVNDANHAWGEVPIKIGVWFLTQAQIAAGGLQVPTRLNNWTCTTFYGEVFTDSDIKITNNSRSSDLAKKPIHFIDQGIASANEWWSQTGYMNTMSAVDPITGKLRVRCAGDIYVTTASSSARNFPAFSFVLDPVNKTATLDDGAQTNLTTPPVRAYVQANGQPTLEGAALKGWSDLYANNASANWVNSSIITDKGWQFTYACTAPSLTDSVDTGSRGQLSNFVSRYEALKPRNGAVAKSWVYSSPSQFGSSVGGFLAGLVRLDATTVLLRGAGRNKNGQPVTGHIYAKLGADGFTYKTPFVSGTRSGYAPNGDRQMLSDVPGHGLTNMDLGFMVNECDGTNYRLHSQMFTSAKLSGYAQLSAGLVKSGSLSITSQVFEAAKAAALQAALVNYSVVHQATATLVVPSLTGCPPFWLVTARVTNDRTVIVLMMRATVTVSNGVITGVTTGSQAGGITAYSGGAAAITEVLDFDQESWGNFGHGALCILKVADGFVVAGKIGSQYRHAVSGVAAIAVAGLIANSGSNRGLKSANDAPSNPTVTGVLDKSGIGMTQGSGVTNDYRTKLILPPYSNVTEAGWNGASPVTGPAGSKVIISQDLPAGFTLYFTESNTVIVNGVVFIVPPLTLDLSTVDASPANKTFYLYIEVANGAAALKAYSSFQAESTSRLLIGTAVTDATGVTNIVVEKVTRFAGFRLSQTPRGSSIPVTPGLPSREAHLDSNWF